MLFPYTFYLFQYFYLQFVLKEVNLYKEKDVYAQAQEDREVR